MINKITLNNETKEFYKLNFPIYYQLINLNEQLFVMSDIIDQIGEVTLFKFFKPHRIIELGAATGNWCVIMNSLSDKSIEQHFTLVEDFSWHNTEIKLDKQFAINYNFPKNKIELENNIANYIKSFNVIDKSVEQLIQEDLEQKVDLIRIDCDIKDMMQWDKVLEWIDRNGSDNLIVLSDDIRSTSAPHRMLIMQQLVAQGKFRLMWIGEDTAAWCRINIIEKVYGWFDYILNSNEHKLMSIDKRNVMLYGFKQEYLHTKRTRYE